MTSEQHFHAGNDELSCTICGQGRFAGHHVVGTRDLPVERTFCHMEEQVARKIFELLAAENLLPLTEVGVAVEFERFNKQVLDGLYGYLLGIKTFLDGLDGPLYAYRQLLINNKVPVGGFERHLFENEEGGLLCQACGMIERNALHSAWLTM